MQNVISLLRKNIVKDSEINLVKKAKKGDKEAYVILFKKYKNSLYTIAFSYVKDKEKALDIISEATYKGMINISTLKKEEFFKTWITRMVINIAKNDIKKSDRYVYGNEGYLNIADNRKINVCEKLDLYEAMDKLKDNYKTVIILRYFDDMSIDEISKVMEIPVNTVKSHLRRAKEMLKGELKEGYLNEY